MSFIQTELDRTAFAGPAAWPDEGNRQAPPMDIAFSCDERAAPVITAMPNLIDEIAAFGLPGQAVPLVLTLTTGAPSGWLLAALGLSSVVFATKAIATGSHNAQWLLVTGYAVLALGFVTIAGDHAAALIAYAGTTPTVYMTMALTALLAATAWLLARYGVTFATRDLLVIEGLTLGLTLIVLANHATLSGAALATYRGATPLASIAADVGLTTLSPILSAGIAFSFFVAGSRSSKGLAESYTAIAAARTIPSAR